MNRLINYANALSLMAFAQAVRIEQMQRQLDQNADVMMRCRETIEDMTKALLGQHYTITVEE